MGVKEDYLRLKERWVQAKGAEREQVQAELDAFFDSLSESDTPLLEEAVNEDFERIHKKMAETEELGKRIQVRKQLESILPFISVAALAKNYFGKSSSWFYQRLNGNVVHGKAAAFTEGELKTLNYALQDISTRLANAACWA